MTLAEFNSKYVYVYDWVKWDVPAWVDVWEVIDEKNGVYEGDCESYCLTLKDKVDGFKELELWYCKINGDGHCVGKIYGKWIDCNFKELRDKLPYNYTNVRPYKWWEVLSKKVSAQIVFIYLRTKYLFARFYY